ncbi:MAG: GNAT family N-acetyltransferase [Promethearchaeota archaeon]
MKVKQIFAKDFPNNKKELFTYTSKYYYELNMTEKPKDEGWVFEWTKKPLKEPFIKKGEGNLFENYKEDAEYYVFLNDEEEEIGVVVIGMNQANNTARVWDIYVNQKYQRFGYGTQLMEYAEERARTWGCRAMIVECQSSNYNAIQFYQKNGFELIGFDLIWYSNTDVDKREVRLEMGKKLSIP